MSQGKVFLLPMILHEEGWEALPTDVVKWIAQCDAFFVEEEKTASGLYIPNTAQEKPQKGTVIAVGTGTKDEEMQVKEGDVVIFGKYSGTEITLDGKKYLMMHQTDIMAII